MSRWVTLNIEAEDWMPISDELPDELSDFHTVEDSDAIVAYTFSSASLGDRMDDIERTAAEIAIQKGGAKKVIGIQAGDTADWVSATEDVVSQAAIERRVVEGREWTGQHSYCTDSEVIKKIERYIGYRPNLGGNWYDEKEKVAKRCD